MSRKYYNTEKNTEYQRRYRAKHREQMQEYWRKLWAERTPERVENDKKRQADYIKEHRPLINSQNRQRYIERREFLSKMKAESGCMECGFKDPRALQFHHRDPSNKKFGLAGKNMSRHSMENIIEETAKCDVLCANCHFILHAKERD